MFKKRSFRKRSKPNNECETNRNVTRVKNIRFSFAVELGHYRARTFLPNAVLYTVVFVGPEKKREHPIRSGCFDNFRLRSSLAYRSAPVRMRQRYRPLRFIRLRLMIFEKFDPIGKRRLRYYSPALVAWHYVHIRRIRYRFFEVVRATNVLKSRKNKNSNVN